MRRLRVIQLDSVNVLERAHYLPAFSRLGPYERSLLDRLAHRAPRTLFEYWGHEASLIDVRLQPSLRWRMARARDEAWGGMRRIAHERPELVAAVLDEVRERGPLRAADLAHHEGREHVRGDWWSWSDVKRSLEYLFWAGEITSARRVHFERRYDLPERVLPRAAIEAPTPDLADAQRTLLAAAADALGVATAADLRDYFRISAADAAPRIAELVESGAITPVRVEGWRQQAFLVAGARIPRRASASALLCPFDPLIWSRDRAERLFGFRYRIEIYVPEHKRQHGYYVFPFMLDGSIVARVDLKADRAGSALIVKAAHAEPHSPVKTGELLAAELESLAGWLGLSAIRWQADSSIDSLSSPG